MSSKKRKRPKEEFLADLRPLKRRLTWKEAINRVFKEYPIGCLMGKDQIKSEFLSIHKIDKLRNEPNEKIEEQFEKRLEEFTNEDILFEHQDVYSINPQITSTTFPISQTDLPKSSEEIYLDIEKLEKEIDETYSQDDGEVIKSTKKEDYEPCEINLIFAIKLVLNELIPGKKFLTNLIIEKLEEKIEKKEIKLSSVAIKNLSNNFSDSLVVLLLSGWKTDSGNELSRRDISMKEREDLSALRKTRYVYWLGKLENEEEYRSKDEDKNSNESFYSEEEKDSGFSPHLDLETEIEGILRDSGEKMSSSQIHRKMEHKGYTFSSISTKLLYVVNKKKNSSLVRRLRCKGKLKRKWKKKNENENTPHFLYFLKKKKKKLERKQMQPPPQLLSQHPKQTQSKFFENFQNLDVLVISPNSKISERNRFHILDLIKEKSSEEFSSKTQIIEYFEQTISHVKLLKIVEYHHQSEKMNKTFQRLRYLKKMRFKDLLVLEEIQEYCHQNGKMEIHLLYEPFGTCGSEISKLSEAQVKILIRKSVNCYLRLLNIGLVCFVNPSDIFYRFGEENKVKFLLWNNFEFCNFGEIERGGKRFISHLRYFYNELFSLIGKKDVISDGNQLNGFKEFFGRVLLQLQLLDL